MSTQILFVGATGYIGGTVLAKLIEHPSANTFSITVLTRSQDKAKLIEEKFPQLKVVVGSTDDEETLERLASESHVVIGTADADNLPAVKAILRGLRKRHATVGDLPIFIHTVETDDAMQGVLTTPDNGLKVGENVYDDADPKSIASLPPTQVHRDVDLAIVEADEQGKPSVRNTRLEKILIANRLGYLKSYIILPSTIYGLADHALTKAGISNPRSIQVPLLIKASLRRGAPGVVGKGVSIWPSVHIDEVADLYIRILDGIVNNNPAVGHGADGFYFGISDHHTWYELSKEIGRVMVQKGLTKSDEPTPFSDEELVKYFGSVEGGNYYGSTSRGIPNHSKAIGWDPKKTKKDLFASITPELEALL
ncbi:hypothetical protein BXZ70DRAFT_909660 [Cristinia sonorae]|uniref:NmrA-like domain-containing protein n=1 Tax=Cristinia sonorae TaxID=1940300 RepID=A0A8K0UJP0_9AGAR|nr:hypothetical protein BXZ70DRAFT_909660 [Cristinia sonorae]